MTLPLINRWRMITGILLMSMLLLLIPVKIMESPALETVSLQRSKSGSPALPFGVGEKLTYNVSWKIFDAGVATMVVVDRVRIQNDEMFKINATVRSTGIVSVLFKVVDVFESLFHARELCSHQIMKNILEGKRHRSTIVTFDRSSSMARMEDKDLAKPDSPVKRLESPIPSCVQDVISALYVVRTKSLKVGEEIHFPISDGGRTYDVVVEIQAEEEIRTPAGTFQALRLEPRVFNGLFKSRGRLFVWFTKDNVKMPVLFKARMNIGTITAALTQTDRSSPAQ